MKKYYKLVILLLFFSAVYSQQESENFYVSKAWEGQGDEWSDVIFKPAIIISANTEGALKIVNNSFLYGLCGGKAKFSDKNGYNSAELASPRMILTRTDEKGVLNTTYEGMLVFQSDGNYFSTSIQYTLLIEKNKIVGLKIHKKGDDKEYAFGLVPKV